jgi:glycerophosphoryl diester phosphodiesterase
MKLSLVIVFVMAMGAICGLGQVRGGIVSGGVGQACWRDLMHNSEFSRCGTCGKQNILGAPKFSTIFGKQKIIFVSTKVQTRSMGTKTLPEIIIEAHRGWGDLLPENSLEAFEQAVTAGIDSIEIDVHCTKDKIVVVTHGMTPLGLCHLIPVEAAADSLDWKPVILEKTTFADLQKFRMPDTSLLMPTLKQVLAIVSKSPTLKINIELKSAFPDHIGHTLDCLLENKFPLERIVFSGFVHGYRKLLLAEEKKRGIVNGIGFGFLANTLQGHQGLPTFETIGEFFDPTKDMLTMDIVLVLNFGDEINERIAWMKDAGLKIIGTYTGFAYCDFENARNFKWMVKWGVNKFIVNRLALA